MANKRLYESPKQLKAKVDEYFQLNKIWTGYGLQLHLGFRNHNTIRAYCKVKEFSGIIERAYMKIASQHEENLVTAKNPTGSIFWLKSNNFARTERWVDTVENKVSGDIKVNVNISGNKNISLDNV